MHAGAWNKSNTTDIYGSNIHYNILFILQRNHSIADRWKSVAIQCPRRFQISLLIDRHWLNQSTDLQNHRGLKRSMMVSDRRRITQSPLSSVQSPILVTKITVADCCGDISCAIKLMMQSPCNPTKKSFKKFWKKSWMCISTYFIYI